MLFCEIMHIVLCTLLIHVQHYIHGSSQGQFIVETYIVIFLRILLCFYRVISIKLSLFSESSMMTDALETGLVQNAKITF